MIFLSFLVALFLMVLPLPDAVLRFRPDWVALTLIYWCLAAPARVGVGSGWLAGLMLDVIQIGLLGKNAIALSLVAYLICQFHLRIRAFPVIQQALVVFIVLLMQFVIIVWIQSIWQGGSLDFEYWTQAAASMLAWPLVFVILRAVRRRAGIK